MLFLFKALVISHVIHQNSLNIHHQNKNKDKIFWNGIFLLTVEKISNFYSNLK